MTRVLDASSSRQANSWPLGLSVTSRCRWMPKALAGGGACGGRAVAERAGISVSRQKPAPAVNRVEMDETGEPQLLRKPRQPLFCQPPASAAARQINQPARAASHLRCDYSVALPSVPPDRRLLKRVHRPCPGNRTSQKVQPLTGCCVMLIAAADGVSKRLPLSTSAPDKTSAR